MSNSEMQSADVPAAGSPSSLVPLVAQAADATTEIFIIDGRFNRVAKGLGRLEVKLPPGMYKVKFKAGDCIQEVHQDVRPNAGVVQVMMPELSFDSAAPLQNTATSHEYHQSHANRTSSMLHAQLGSGSQLMVFVRDFTPPPPAAPLDDPTIGPLLRDLLGEDVAKLLTTTAPDGDGEAVPIRPVDDPATGLTLHDADGNLLLNLSQSGERSPADDPGDKWASCNVELDPGSYRLRVQMQEIGALEQTIVTCHRWQTQVFLLRRPYGQQDVVYRADLGKAAVLMSRLGEPFQPWERSLRLSELARQGLENGRAVVSDLVLRAAVQDESVRPRVSKAVSETISAQSLEEMLNGKHTNPMLGIYGAHLLISRLVSRQRNQAPNTPPQSEQVQSDQPVDSQVQEGQYSHEAGDERDVLRTVVSNLHKLIGDNHPDVMALDVWLGEGVGAVQTLRGAFRTPPMLRSSWEIIIEASREHPDIFAADSFAAQIAPNLWGSGAWLIWRAPAELSPLQPSVAAGQTTLQPDECVAQALELSSLAGELLGDLFPQRISLRIGASGMEMFLTNRDSMRDLTLNSAVLASSLGLPYVVATAAMAELAAKLAPHLGKLKTGAPIEPDFQPLFDGTVQTFKDWRFVGEGGFALVNGTLEAQPGSDFGVLYYGLETFENFILRLQFRLQRGSDDSGIFVRFRDPLQLVPDRSNAQQLYRYDKKHWVPVHTGFEVQLDELARGNPPERDEHRSGAIYDVPLGSAPGEQSYTRPASLSPGVWHDAEIEVHSSAYTVRLNGEQTTFFLNADFWRGTAPSQDPNSGYIGVQSCFGSAAFKHIRIKRL